MSRQVAPIQAAEVKHVLPPVTVITSCSVSRTIQPLVCVEDMPEGMTMREACLWWTTKMASFEPEITPREQYKGLGFSTLVKIQEAYPNVKDVEIVTGGLGLTNIDEPIVPYDFTASKDEEHNVWQKVTKEPFVQTVWWKMINAARGKDPNPIATLVRENPETFFLISASKVFLRYCAEDVLSIPLQDRHRVRVLLAASSVGSVPIQLRPMLVPFDRSAITHLIGNRNDTNHRAAFLFLQKMYEQGATFLEQTPGQQAVAFRGEGYQTGEKLSLDKLTEILESNPAYLKMDAEAAYKYVRREHGALGGRMLFRSVHRRLVGIPEAPPISQEDAEKAKNSLSGLAFLTTPTQASSNNDEAEAIKGIRLFVHALKGLAPKAVFTASDVVSWAKNYYGEQPPAYLVSPNKMIHVLKNNCDLLGLTEVELQSGRAYQLTPDS